MRELKQLQVQRHELKYYISRADYEYAKLLLDQLMQKDEYQEKHAEYNRGYFIRSLYLDDALENSLEEKIDGVEHRDKYRLRIYDFDQDWVKLERKRKVNQYVNKESVTISKDEAQEIAEGNYDCLLTKSTPAARSIYFDLKRKYFRPVVIVDYIRDVYKLDYNEVRITFDKHIRSSTKDLSLFDPGVITDPILRDDVIVMEVKFNGFLPHWFKDFLSFESAQSVAISKYTQCRMHVKNFYSY